MCVAILVARGKLHLPTGWDCLYPDPQLAWRPIEEPCEEVGSMARRRARSREAGSATCGTRIKREMSISHELSRISSSPVSGDGTEEMSPTFRASMAATELGKGGILSAKDLSPTSVVTRRRAFSLLVPGEQ